MDELQLAKRIAEVRECSFMNYEEAYEFVLAEAEITVDKKN